MSAADRDRERPRLHVGQVAPGSVDAFGPGVELLGTVAGHPVRVIGAVPGDRGLLRVTHVGQHQRRARLERLDVPSPDRVPAPCPVWETCGGCPWQAVSIPAQRAARLAALRDALGPALEGATVHPWATEPAPVGYRTRAWMMVRGRPGALRLGFFAPGSNALVATDRCIAQHPAIDDALRGALALLNARRLTAWRGAGDDGLVRALGFRLDPATGLGPLTLVASRPDPVFTALAPDLLALPGVSGVFLNLQPAQGGPVIGSETRHLAGAPRQPVTFEAGEAGSLTLALGPTAFVQTNHRVAEALLRVVAAALPPRMAHLADVYAGAGAFGLALRARAARVTLLEDAPAAVSDAHYNVAALGDAGHVALMPGDAAEGLARLVARDPAPDAVVVDPPRAGCAEPVLAALTRLASGVPVVYVSCNPRSLARDLARLADAFAATDLVPLDMFPHTPHMETVVRLVRR